MTVSDSGDKACSIEALKSFWLSTHTTSFPLGNMKSKAVRTTPLSLETV